MINVSERRLPPELADLPCTRAEIAYEVAPGGPMPSLEGRFLTGRATSTAATLLLVIRL